MPTLSKYDRHIVSVLPSMTSDVVQPKVIVHRTLKIRDIWNNIERNHIAIYLNRHFGQVPSSHAVQYNFVSNI